METLPPPPQSTAGALGLVAPLGREREDLAPAKTLRTRDSRLPKKEAPLIPSPACRAAHGYTPHGAFSGTNVFRLLQGLR